MTFGTTALWLGSTTHTTRVARNGTAGRYAAPFATFAGGISPTTAGGAHGVIGDDDLLVTVTTGLGYSVAAGRAVMLGGSAAAQGAYEGIYNDAALTGSVGAHHATLPRKDIIAVRVRDTDEDASGSEDCGLVVIAGTAAGSPADPTVPANHLVLARANVPATSGNITIDDLRTYATGLGGIHRCRSSTRPTGAALKTVRTIRETDTQRVMYYTDAGAWDYVSEPPTAWSPGLSQGSGVTFTATGGMQPWYQRSRGVFTAQCSLSCTSAGSAGNSIGLTFPFTLPNLEYVGGSFQLYDASAGIIYAGIVAPNSTTVMIFYTDQGGPAGLGNTPAVTLASGDVLRVTVTGRY